MKPIRFSLIRHAAATASLVLLCSPIAQAQLEPDVLEEVIRALQGDDFDARHQARMQLQAAVSKSSAPDEKEARMAMESQLLEQLQEPHEQSTQIWLLRQIASIGSEQAVDPLAELAKGSDRHVAEAARMALQDNPSDSASQALLDLLIAAPSDEFAMGCIGSLAARKYAPAVDAFDLHLRGESDALGQAAAAALAAIGDDKALASLRASRKQAKGPRLAAIEGGIVAVSRDFDELSDLAANGSNRSIQAGAFGRCVDLNANRANALFKELLANEAIAHRGDFIPLALDANRPALTRSALQSLPTLPADLQAVALGALPSKANKTAEAIAIDLASSENEPLKVQAIEALGRFGSIASLPLLLENLVSRSRELRETSAEAIARIDDRRVDRQLLRDASSGEEAKRLVAIKALGHRASPGAAALVNRLASAGDESKALRKEALSAMELIGDADSFTVLTQLIIDDGSGLRRDAQLVLKRMTLRAADPERAWAAFEASLEAADEDAEAQRALLAVLDAAPSAGAIEHAKSAWAKGEPEVRSALLRVLPLWRNWDGGFAMAEFATADGTSPENRQACFDGIGRLILGSTPNHSIDGKFELAGIALAAAVSEEERQPILNGFRYSTWRERVYVENNDVDPGLKEAVLEYAE